MKQTFSALSHSVALKSVNCDNSCWKLTNLGKTIVLYCFDGFGKTEKLFCASEWRFLECVYNWLWAQVCTCSSCRNRWNAKSMKTDWFAHLFRFLVFEFYIARIVRETGSPEAHFLSPHPRNIYFWQRRDRVREKPNLIGCANLFI